MCLRCGEIFKDYFITHLLLSLMVKEIWEFVNIWEVMGKNQLFCLFMFHFFAQSYEYCSYHLLLMRDEVYNRSGGHMGWWSQSEHNYWQNFYIQCCLIFIIFTILFTFFYNNSHLIWTFLTAMFMGIWYVIPDVIIWECLWSCRWFSYGVGF